MFTVTVFPMSSSCTSEVPLLPRWRGYPFFFAAHWRPSHKWWNMVCSCPDRRRFCLYHFSQITRKQRNSGKNGKVDFFKKKLSSSICVKFSRNLTHILTGVWVSMCDVFCGLFLFNHTHTYYLSQPMHVPPYQVYLPAGISQIFPIMSRVRYSDQI